MRHVDRSSVRVPQVFGMRAQEEQARAETFYQERRAQRDEPVAPSGGGSPRKRPKAFEFAVYGDDEVRTALGALFGGKCAYCESRYAATQPVDVEHFRPKGGVDGDATHEGYWWLAADWENLLPSCIDCNRERRQEIPASADGTEPTRTLVLGKGNRFPLEPGSARGSAKGQEISERPLLLNPCRDQPDEELEFTDDGIVRARRDESGAARPRGRESIEVYALNRSGLVHSRLEVLRLVQARMYTIQRLVEVLDLTRDNEIEDVLEDLLTYELAELNRFRGPERAYSAMCEQVISQFVAGITIP